MKNFMEFLKQLSEADSETLWEINEKMERIIEEKEESTSKAQEALEDILQIEKDMNNCSTLDEAEKVLKRLEKHKTKYKEILNEGHKKLMEEDGADFVAELQEENMLLPVIVSMLLSENGGTIKIPYDKLKNRFINSSGLAILPSKEYVEVKTIE